MSRKRHVACTSAKLRDCGCVWSTAEVGGLQSRRAVASLGRAELEDRHISLLEENHVRHETNVLAFMRV